MQGVLLLRSRYEASQGAVFPLDILPQSDIDGIVILGDIPIDVVQSAVAHLNVNLAAEYKEEIPDHWNVTWDLPCLSKQEKDFTWSFWYYFQKQCFEK